MDTQKRIKNPEALARLGGWLRQQREQGGITQRQISTLRQATVSRIENGSDVTLDTFISYATALGLEVALVPIGQAALCQARLPGQPPRPLDFFSEFADLQDEEQ